MNLLTLNECSLVTGGLQSHSSLQSGRTEHGTGTGHAGTNRWIPIKPINGPGGYGAYAGYLGNIGGYSNYSGDDYFQFGSQYAGTTVESGDLLVTQPTTTDTADATLEAPNHTEIVDGVFHILGGIAAVAGGIIATVATDGLALTTGGPELAIGFGMGSIVEGAGDLLLNPVHHPRSIENGPDIITPATSGSTTEIA